MPIRPNIEGEAAQAGNRVSAAREHVVAARDPRLDGEAPRRKKKVGPLTAGIATLFALGAVYMLKDNIGQSIVGNNVENVEPDTSERTIINGAKQLSEIYDAQLIVRYNKDTQAVTRAPLYDDMERLSSEVGRSADFQRYQQLMQDVWIGRPAGSGGIWTAQWNPEGTLDAFGRTNAFARTGQVRRLEEITNGYLDQLRNAPGFAAAIGNHPDTKAFMDTGPQRRRLYAMATGQSIPDVIGARGVTINDPAMRDMVKLMPTDANTQSQAFLTLRSVTQALNLRRPGINIDVNALSTALFQAPTDRARVCSLAAQWRNIDANLRTFNEFPAAVADVQRAETAKGSSLNVMNTLNEARDISTRSARNLQTTYRLQNCL